MFDGWMDVDIGRDVWVASTYHFGLQWFWNYHSLSVLGCAVFWVSDFKGWGLVGRRSVCPDFAVYYGVAFRVWGLRF